MDIIVSLQGREEEESGCDHSLTPPSQPTPSFSPSPFSVYLPSRRLKVILQWRGGTELVQSVLLKELRLHMTENNCLLKPRDRDSWSRQKQETWLLKSFCPSLNQLLWSTFLYQFLPISKFQENQENSWIALGQRMALRASLSTCFEGGGKRGQEWDEDSDDVETERIRGSKRNSERISLS